MNKSNAQLRKKIHIRVAVLLKKLVKRVLDFTSVVLQRKCGCVATWRLVIRALAEVAVELGGERVRRRPGKVAFLV